MKSKSNPFMFRALASGAALFAIAPLHAADVDTTGTTVTLAAENKYIGNGTINVNGGGDLWLGNSAGAPITEFAMTGGLINIASGTTLQNGGWQKGVWTNNQATLQVDGVLNMNDGNNIFAGALTGSGTVIVPGSPWFTNLNQSITVGVNGGGGTFSGNISDNVVDDDTVNLIKIGGGTQILTGTNTYTGGTTVTGGTLTLGTGGAVGVIRNSLTINSGATVSAGAEGWSLGYANGTSVTDITLNGGTLNFTGGSNLGGTSANAITFSTSPGTISGTDFDWYNANTTTPTLTVNAAASGSVISSGINLRLTSSGNLTMNVADGADSNDMLVSGVIRDGVSDAGASIIKTGAGTLTLSGANSYSGGTTISAGTLKLQGTAFSTTARAYSIASSAVLNLDGGALVASGNTTISGTGTLRISGGGLVSGADGRDLTLALGSGALIDIQSDASMYNGGWQNMTWTNNLAGLQVNGTLEMGDGQWMFADALTGSGAVTMNVGWTTWHNHLTVGVNGGGGTFDGTISDSGDDTIRLTKTGGGTQILTGTNTYRGTTTVNGGSLVVNGNISTSSLTTVQSGGTLGGSGTVGSLTVNSGAFLNPGNSPGILSVDGDYNQAGTLNIEIGGLTAGSQHDQVNVDLTTGDLDGSVTLSGSLVTAFSGGTYVNGDLLFILLNDGSDAISGTFSGLAQDAIVTNYGGFDWKISYTADSTGNTFTGGNDVALMAVPEPNVAALLGGLGVVALLRRRR